MFHEIELGNGDIQMKFKTLDVNRPTSKLDFDLLGNGKTFYC